MLTKPHIIKRKIRWIIYHRENKQCFYCDVPLSFNAATIDHIIPKSNGGALSVDNSVCACWQCNHERGNIPADIYLTLKLTGGVPKYKKPGKSRSIWCANRT